MKTVAYSSFARRQLKKLPVQAQAEIESAVADFAATNRGDVKKLQGRDGYRLRVGVYRVIMDLNGAVLTILAVGDRKNIYQ